VNISSQVTSQKASDDFTRCGKFPYYYRKLQAYRNDYKAETEDTTQNIKITSTEVKSSYNRATCLPVSQELRSIRAIRRSYACVAPSNDLGELAQEHEIFI
jgi:hypothetical protein